MERIFNLIAVLFIITYCYSCIESNEKAIKKFTIDNLDSYLVTERNLDINRKCGLVNNIPIEILREKVFVSIYIRCAFYKGDIINKNKRKELVFNNKIYISSDSILINNMVYNIHEFENTLNKNIFFDKENSLLIVRNDWTSYKNIHNFLEILNRNYQDYNFIFEFKNEKYYEDYKNNYPIFGIESK